MRHTRDEKDVLASRFNKSLAGSYFNLSINDPVDYRCGGFVAANTATVAGPTATVADAYNFVCANNSISYSTYRLAADYKLDRDHMVYASDSTGIHAGGFNTGAVNVYGVPTLLPFAPEKVSAFEVGSKNTFLNRRVTLNAAAYVNDYTDLHAQTSIPNPNAP